MLSDGVDSLAASVASGELPPRRRAARPGGQRRRGHRDAGDHPRPRAGAALGFATAFISDASFADNIRALRSDAHCDIIVDDVFYFDESPFQDGPIAQAVNDVTADGALYFSSAGNEGNVDDGTPATGRATSSTPARRSASSPASAHDFDPGPRHPGPRAALGDSAGVPVTLWWNDPLGTPATTTTCTCSTPPATSSASAERAERHPGPVRALSRRTGGTVAPGRGEVQRRQPVLPLTRSAAGSRRRRAQGVRHARASPAATPRPRAPSASRRRRPQRALPIAGARRPGQPARVRTRARSPSARSRAVHLRRPAPGVLQPDGTPITPGNFTSTGGAVRQKPDITAADGVQHLGRPASRRSSARRPPRRTRPPSRRSCCPATPACLARRRPAGADRHRDRHRRRPASTTAPAGVILADRVLAYTGASPQPLARPGRPPSPGDRRR